MKRIPSTSSNIASHGHDPETNTMEIEFKSGGTYQYKDVSPEKYEEFKSSDSHGSFFHHNIRNQHHTTKL